VSASARRTKLDVDERHRAVCSSSARASESVRFGRFISSRNSAPFAKLLMPNRWTKMVFGPTERIMSRSD
jgi:hypothetical protein